MGDLDLPGAEADGLQRRLEDSVLWLVLDRPNVANTFTQAIQRTMADTLEGINRRSDIRAVVLTATGSRHFCGGPDLRDPGFAPRPDRAAGDASRTLREGSQRVVASMLDCEKPVLCGLNGTAVGGGANLALAADLIIASESARLVELFTSRGLIPDGGAAYLLARHLPRNLVKQMVLMTTELTADEGKRLGLYNLVVPSDRLHQTVQEWAGQLSGGPSRAFAAAKALLNGSIDSDRSSAFAIEAALVEQVAATADVAEGVTAFLEKRAARFQGR